MFIGYIYRVSPDKDTFFETKIQRPISQIDYQEKKIFEK